MKHLLALTVGLLVTHVVAATDTVSITTVPAASAASDAASPAAAPAPPRPGDLEGKMGMGVNIGLSRYQGDEGSGLGSATRGLVRWHPWNSWGFQFSGSAYEVVGEDPEHSHALEGGLDLIMAPSWLRIGSLRPWVQAGGRIASLQRYHSGGATHVWMPSLVAGLGADLFVAEQAAVGLWLESVQWSDPADGWDAIEVGNGSFLDIRDEVLRAGVGLSFWIEPLRDGDRDGVPDRADGCVAEAEDRDGFRDDDGCPDLDNDQDGVPDLRDRCPSKPEDLDGFEDQDGCPDLDNDQDGFPDASDRCPNDAEDRDGQNDTDGCPDLDNDQDGIPDATDRCPTEREDVDGFEDTDGCSDLDNDKDGIPDAADRCPDQSEDRDGFEDTDGCAELDNDKDGIPDSQDACPNDREVINGLQDEDGCPDVKVEVGEAIVLEGIIFRTGSAEIDPSSRSILERVASSLVANPREVVEIRGYTDNQGNEAANKRLSQRRAEAVRAVLISLGVEPANVRARGLGEASPRAPNATAEGRALNRRIEFFRVR